jgi:hypothetical protein
VLAVRPFFVAVLAFAGSPVSCRDSALAAATLFAAPVPDTGFSTWHKSSGCGLSSCGREAVALAVIFYCQDQSVIQCQGHGTVGIVTGETVQLFQERLCSTLQSVDISVAFDVVNEIAEINQLLVDFTRLLFLCH